MTWAVGSDSHQSRIGGNFIITPVLKVLFVYETAIIGAVPAVSILAAVYSEWHKARLEEFGHWVWADVQLSRRQWKSSVNLLTAPFGTQAKEQNPSVPFQVTTELLYWASFRNC